MKVAVGAYDTIVKDGKPLNAVEFLRFTESLDVRINDDLNLKLNRMGVVGGNQTAVELLYPGFSRDGLRHETFEQHLLREMMTRKPDLVVGDMLEPFRLRHPVFGRQSVATGADHVVLAYLARRESREQYVNRTQPDAEPLPEGFYVSENRDSEWDMFGMLKPLLYAVRANPDEEFTCYFWPQMKALLGKFRNGKRENEPFDAFEPYIKKVVEQQSAMALFSRDLMAALNPDAVLRAETFRSVQAEISERYHEAFNIAIKRTRNE